MDTKQLVDDFINGKITEEQFDAEKAKLSPEAQQQLLKDAEAAKPDAVETLKNIRRGIEKVTPPAPASEQNTEAAKLIEQQRTENMDDAFSSVFTELGIDKVEDQNAFKEGFKNAGSKSVTVKSIVKDMKSFYGSANADSLIDLKKQQREREIAAEEETARAAGGNGSGSGQGGGGDKVSKEVKAYMEKSAKAGRVITKEQAEKALAMAGNKGRLPNPTQTQ